ncbi:MAG: DMT family transporter [Patescibacteria group bacterium]
MKLKIKNKKIFAGLSLLLFLGVFFLFPNIVHAGVGETVATVLGWILYPIIWVLGQILIMLMYILIGVAQYNSFINSNAVSFGWTLVRDLCNMFFILILLIIAFATILRVEQYNLKTWLPKLVLMAVLINFSKLICGIFIDVAQVIMLTFVNAFKDMAGGNLTDMLGVTKILSFDQNNSEDVTGWTILGSIILALIFSIVSVVVVLTMLVMLAMRIIMIWIYVVLSPLAYLLASFPQGQSYSQRWWTDFSKNLIVGPILAFFIWLSFASLGGIEGSRDINKMKTEEAGQEAFSASISEAGSQDNMTKFIISIGMLLGGLMIAQEMGGMAGSVAGKGMAKLQAMGSGAMNSVSKGAKRVTGIERAQNALKVRQSMKEGVRQERAQKDAGALLRAESKAKKAIASVPDKGRQLVDRGMQRAFGVNSTQTKINEAKEQRKALEEKKKKIEVEFKDSIGKGDAMISQANNLEQTQTRFNQLQAETQKNPGNLEAKEELKMVGADLSMMKKNAGLAVNADETAVATKVKELRDGGEKEKENDKLEDINKQISAKDSEIQQHETVLGKQRKRSENWSKATAGIGGAVLGGALAIATGGVAVGGLGALAAGAFTGGAAGIGGRKKIMRAGESDADLASNHNNSQISKAKEGFKDSKENEIRDVMNDYSRSGHERTAAAMVLMERGKLDQNEAVVHRDKIKSSYGYDNKVMNALDGSLNNEYQHLTRDFSDLNAPQKPDEDDGKFKKRQDEARDKIVKGVVSGSIKIENIDKGSMELVIPALVKTMSNKRFKSHYDDLPKQKQKEVKESLRSSGEYDSLKKLAIINDADMSHLDKESDKAKFMAEIEVDEVRKMVTKEESSESLKKFLTESPLADDLRRAGTSGNEKEFTNKLNEILKNSKLSLDSAPERAIIKRIEELMGLSFSKPRPTESISNQKNNSEQLSDKDEEMISNAAAVLG